MGHRRSAAAGLAQSPSSNALEADGDEGDEGDEGEDGGDKGGEGGKPGDGVPGTMDDHGEWGEGMTDAEKELVNAIQAVFDRWDVDRSGLLSLDEFRRGIQEEARSPEFRNDPTVRLVVSAVTAARGEASPLVA